MLENEITALGARLNLPALAFDNAGRIALHIEHMGSVHLELCTQDRNRQLILYLARPIAAHDTAQVQQMLDICHYRHNHPYTVQAGVHSNMGFLLLRFDDTVTAAEIEQGILFLAKTMDGLRAGA